VRREVTSMDAKLSRRYLADEWERLLVARDAIDEAHRTDETERSLGELSTLDQHQADVGSEVFEREKELSIRAQVDDDLQAVLDALCRVETGTYGRCESCRQPIPDERLVAVPSTRFCVEHEREWELRSFSLHLPAGEFADAASAEHRAEREALEHLEFLPTDDDVTVTVEVDPEEAALHGVGPQ